MSGLSKNVKIIIAAAVSVLILVAGIATGILISSHRGDKDSYKASEESDSRNEQVISSNGIQKDKEQDKKWTDAAAEFKAVNSWESEGKKFTQYELTVTNHGSSAIDEWKINFPVGSTTQLSQSWNCDISVDNNNGNVRFILVPADYNKKLEAGAKTQGIGFIVSMTDDYKLGDYDIETVVTDDTLTASNVSDQMSEQVSGQASDQLSGQYDENADSQDNNSRESNDNEDSSGQLHVSGTDIIDGNGNVVRLKGVSTHGLAWYPQYVNYDAFRTLRDDWGVNVIRLAMYTQEYGGYCNGGDREGLKQLIDNGVSYASQLGMYVIIDWHILSDGNPNQHKDEALEFFDEMSSKYAGYNNVIYEICNEPQNSDWNSQIKPYAQEVIARIRQHTDALILVGTNRWSQDVDEVIGNRLDDDNVMYVVHFYAGTQKEWVRNKMIAALDAGIPVFISECSICDASGNGGIDYGSADAWFSLLNERGISYIAWSLSNKSETSALINSWCDKLSDWSDDDLSDTGRWFKNMMSR